MALTRPDASTKRLAAKIALYGFPAICMIVYGMGVRNAEYPRQVEHSSILLFLKYLATSGILFMIFAIVFSPDKRHKGLIYTTILALLSVLFINMFYEVKLSLFVIILLMIWIFFCGMLFYRVHKIINIALWAVFTLILQKNLAKSRVGSEQWAVCSEKQEFTLSEFLKKVKMPHFLL